MASSIALRVTSFLLTSAGLAFALPAAAGNNGSAPIVYKTGSGQGGSVPQPDRAASQDAWRGPVTRTGSVTLPNQRERVEFAYPGSKAQKVSQPVRPLRQMASVEQSPKASRPQSSDEMWPTESPQTPKSQPVSETGTPRTLTLGMNASVPATQTPRVTEAAAGPVTPQAAKAAHEERGLASWYGADFDGKPTANGEIFDMTGMTAAHRTLPLPSLVQVTNEANGKEIVVRVNDRGPFTQGRIIDLSKRAAETLDIIEQGEAPVVVRYLGPAPALPGDGDVQMASLETTPVSQPAPAPAPQRPNLYGDMLLGGVEPTLGVPDPGNSEATPARLVPEKSDNASDSKDEGYAPRTVMAENLDSLQRAPQPSRPVQSYQPSRAAAPVQAAYTPQKARPAADAFSPQIFVQIGAFADISNAQGMNAQVGGAFPVDVESVRVNGADYFRVMVGPFANRDAAERAKVQLRTRGMNDSFVVVR
ncbi:septal ring lytic transglycosylase RlpA family protein [Henriciella aquimarina]|uniref:septal ring lytic transglycosylase RlpA family protein n=1 Tax=Henriciella aquimarina TaxID=545261 RepID=UPI00117AC877|nr:septal ring lytic transglycosylase RlpA family protein [Henriciella aquimarina]